MLSFLLSTLLLVPLGADEMLISETYASYYGEAFNGRPTSSGEIFDMNAYTAAHKTLPFGTFLEVTNLENGKKVVVRVNDRGPFVANRELDLSKAAAESLGMVNRGITRVAVKKVDSLDYAALVATNDVCNTASSGQVSPSSSAPPVERKEMDSTQSAPDIRVHQPAEQNPAERNIDKNNTHTVQGAPVQGAAKEIESPESMSGATAEQLAVQPAEVKEVKSADVLTEDALKPENTAREHPDQGQKAAELTAQERSHIIPSQHGMHESTGVLWRIQLGAFTREENALRLVVQLRKAGLNPAYERAEKTVRVVLPSIRESEIGAIKETLAVHSFTDYIIRQESW